MLVFTVNLRSAQIGLKLFLVKAFTFLGTTLTCQMNFSHQMSFISKKQHGQKV